MKEEEETHNEESFLFVRFWTQTLIFLGAIQLPNHWLLVPLEVLEGIHRVLANVTKDLQGMCSLLQRQLAAKQDTLRPVRSHRFKPSIYFCSVFVFTCCLYLMKRICFSKGSPLSCICSTRTSSTPRGSSKEMGFQGETELPWNMCILKYTLQQQIKKSYWDYGCPASTLFQRLEEERMLPPLLFPAHTFMTGSICPGKNGQC